MLGLAGIPLGYRFAFLDPAADAPAGAVGELVVGALDDVGAAERVAKDADIATYEWEGVPAATARALARHLPVLPPARALDVSQDRVTEKDTLRRLGVDTAPYRAVSGEADLHEAVAVLGLPAVLKTRRGGYDGKGQTLLADAADVDGAWERLGGVPLVLEGFVPFDRELSILAVRDRNGDVRCWPAVENHHRHGILRLSRAPAPSLDEALQHRAEACIRPLLSDLDFVGVCCVELFDVDGVLIANEIAPRVHNSGHWTIEGAETSQFENHVRAVGGLPLGTTGARGICAMVNCISTMPDRDAVLRVPGAHLHDYGKQPRVDRKLGHVTIVASDATALDERLAELRKITGFEGGRV